MDFNEWWEQQPKDPTKPITPRMAWNAAILAEQDRRKKICEEKANMRCDYLRTLLAMMESDLSHE